MFLQRYGYIRGYENSGNSVSLIGKNNQIEYTEAYLSKNSLLSRLYHPLGRTN